MPSLPIFSLLYYFFIGISYFIFASCSSFKYIYDVNCSFPGILIRALPNLSSSLFEVLSVTFASYISNV